MEKIRQRDWTSVEERILEYPWDAHYRSADSSTPLHTALMHRAPLAMVRLLVEAFPPALLVADRQGWTPLHIDILYGNDTAKTLFLIRQGGTQAARLHSQWIGSPLHLACRHGSNQEILAALVEEAPEQVATENVSNSTPASLLYKTFLRHHDLDDPVSAATLWSQMTILMQVDDPSLVEVLDFQQRSAAGVDLVGLRLRLEPSTARCQCPTTQRWPLEAACAIAYQAPPAWATEAVPDPLELILKAYPAAARTVSSVNGRLPLHTALADGQRHWSTGLPALVEAYPEALAVRDPLTGLYPGQLASDAETSYHILLAHPEIIASSF